MTPQVAQLLADAVKLHQGGQLSAAENLYQQVLRLSPSHPDALHLLGVLAHQSGRHAQGVELISAALRKSSRVAFYHNNLGECWRGLGNWENAEASYQRAIALDPDYAEAYANLGTIRKNQKKYSDAIQLYRRSLELHPGDPRNLTNLGVVYCETGAYAEAIGPSREAVVLAPDMGEAWICLGVALRRLGRNREAVDVLRRATALAPKDTNAACNLGAALHALGDDREAVKALHAAIAANPNDALPYLHLGNLWRNRQKWERAEQCYQKVLEIDPKSAGGWNNWGLLAKDKGLRLSAATRLRRALEIDPNGEGWSNLGVTLQGMAQTEKAIDCYREALRIGDAGAAASNLVFSLQHCEISPEEICLEAKRWGERVLAAAASWRPALDATRTPHHRLRIGYVSPDFRWHPVAYFISGLLAHHDRSKFEVFCYSTTQVADEMTMRLQGMVEHWFMAAGLSDDELAEQIARDGIDLLVDLAGHTAKNRLQVFARSPARFQATYLGYPGSTGLTTVDFRISDAKADPMEESSSHYVEQVVHLDRCAWCYTPQDLPPPRTVNASSEIITFGCFNNYSKVSDVTIGAWREILSAVPNSRLLLKCSAFNEPEFKDVTWERFKVHGIDPARLLLEARTPTMVEHLARYHAVDIALDTFPYHGTTTTCDALWMGTPVVSWRGNRHSCRVGASLLNAVGLDDLIGGSRDEYIAIAVRLAGDRRRLADLHLTLRGRTEGSAIMNAPQFARSFEAAIVRAIAQKEARLTARASDPS